MIEHERPRVHLHERLTSAGRRATLYVALAAVLALIALPAGTSSALARAHDGTRGDGGNTSAVAVNTTDDSLMFKLSFAILSVTGNVIDNQNVADAYASCDHCETVAISIQTLLVASAANIVAPINEASARNQNCVQCDTLAIAYQFVIAAGTKLEFTHEGRREVAHIRHELERLRGDARRGMTGAQILVAVAALMKQYATVLNTDLVPASQPGAGHHRVDTTGGMPSSATPSAGGDPAAQNQVSNSVANPSVATTPSATPAPADPGSAAPASTTTPTAPSGAATGTTATTPANTTTTDTPPTTAATSGVTTTTPTETTPAETTTTPPSSATP